MSGFQLERLGLIMEPESGNPREVGGTLNPAAVRGPDGQFYLFPRLVAKGDYSRIGIARVTFDGAGDPSGVERLGIALELEADYERLPGGGGGCEDPRITFVEPVRRCLMTYIALSRIGPRIALAISKERICFIGNAWSWQGLILFRGSTSYTWTTRTQLFSRSRYRTTPERCSLPSSTVHFSPAHVPRKSFARESLG